MRRIVSRLVTVLTLIVLMPATLQAQSTAPLKHVTLAIGGRTLFSYLPLTLAGQLGYFRDEGLDVQIADFAGGSKSIEALVGGSVDFAAGAYENTLFLQAKGADIKAVVLLTDRFGLVFALNKKQAATYKSPKDIKGLKIGVTAPGSAVSNALEIILAKDKLTGEDVSMIGIGGGPGAVAAVKAGRVDGLVLSDPAISRLEADGDIVPIVDSRNEDGQAYLYGGPNANSSVLVSEFRARASRHRGALHQRRGADAALDEEGQTRRGHGEDSAGVLQGGQGNLREIPGAQHGRFHRRRAPDEKTGDGNV